MGCDDSRIIFSSSFSEMNQKRGGTVQSSTTSSEASNLFQPCRVQMTFPATIHTSGEDTQSSFKAQVQDF